MKDSLLMRKKVYSSMKMIKGFQQMKLQSEKAAIDQNLEKTNNVIESQEEGIANTLSAIESASSRDLAIDLELFLSHKRFVEKQQEDLLRQQFLQRSLNKRHKDQLVKIKDNYRQETLYRTLVESSQLELEKIFEKKEQEEIDDISSVRYEILRKVNL
jgi:hypothetical protein